MATNAIIYCGLAPVLGGVICIGGVCGYKKRKLEREGGEGRTRGRRRKETREREGRRQEKEEGRKRRRLY